MISHVLVCLLSHEEKGSISNTLQRGSAAVWEQAWAQGFLRGAWLRLSSELTACRRVSIRHPHFRGRKREIPSSTVSNLNCTEFAISKPAGAASSVRV